MIDLYPHGIHVADHTDGMLSLQAACANSHRMLDTISLLVEADLFTIVQNSQRGTPYQMAWRWSNTNVEIETYLIEKQNEEVAALKEACESISATQLGLPDLVVAQVWSFAKPDLRAPDDHG